jgi:hypothetical protein
MKSRKIHIILLLPKTESSKPTTKKSQNTFSELKDKQDENNSRFFILRTIGLQCKPTCLVQLSRKHIAVATGFLGEPSKIEIINVFSGSVASRLEQHTDMIDSMQTLDLNKYTQLKLKSYNSEKMKRLKSEGL